MTSSRGFRSQPICITDGCHKSMWRKNPGLCQSCARLAGLYPELPACPEPGCQRKARSSGAGSRCRKHGGPSLIKEKRTREVSMCAALHCRYAAGDDGLCGTHSNASAAARDRLKCVTESCVNRASRSAGLCHVCWIGRRSTITECKYPLCSRGTVSDYCQNHDLGLDFAAGDWFDWVAAERLWGGHHGARKPTVPELKVVIGQAEKRYLTYAELARQIGVEPNLFERWRHAINRLGEVAA